jgi:hypothetical protein
MFNLTLMNALSLLVKFCVNPLGAGELRNIIITFVRNFWPFFFNEIYPKLFFQEIDGIIERLQFVVELPCVKIKK